jgi:enoyl-CoA hydratase/carnithine racemase
MGELVSYARSDDGTATLRLDDGKMNVLSAPMLRALGAALDRAQADQAVVLVTGRDNVFSAGFDLNVFRHGTRADQLEMLTAGARTAERLLSFPAPVVVAAGGHAIAMGAFLLLAADVRIGVAGARAKYCINEVEIGMTVPRFAVEVCRQRLAPSHFNRALLTAEPYDPQAALEAGFLDQLVPAGDLATAAHARALALAKLVRQAHVATKLRAREPALAAVRRAIDLDIEEWNRR